MLMFWPTWAGALPWLLAAAIATWLISVSKRNVTIVDTLWSLLFLLAAWRYASTTPGTGPREILLLVMVGLWSMRLALYLAWRNFGHAEDARYAAIRRRNSPGFAFKSVYLVFALQAVLAWIISLPLAGAMLGQDLRLGVLDYLGASLWAIGLGFEAIGDWQLARFKANPANQGQVMDRGLWRYTRHPNYFGDCCVWWGFYCVALAAGAWWSIPGPALMTLLLLRYSGVMLLEKHIGKRRPGYADYIRRTNAFFPGLPRER